MLTLFDITAMSAGWLSIEGSQQELSVRLLDANATIARLTAERDEARAAEAAAYEKAANLHEEMATRFEGMAQDRILGIEANKAARERMADNRQSADRIRALATEPGTTALAEIVKRAKADGMREAEAIIREMWASTSAEHSAAILARIDQCKEAV